MEAEEYEQIPWSNLVAETQPSVDRRLYLIGAGVAIIVILIFAMRAFGSSSSQPVAAPEIVPTTVPIVPAESVVSGSDVEQSIEPVITVTEADLLAVGVAESAPRLDTAEFTAEWFVTDFFTRDGSTETLTSLQSMMSPSIASELPHNDPDASDAFVEWARAFRTEDHGATVDVSVAYRSVHAVEGGFVRDPVEAVTITLANLDDHWMVQTMPKITELP